jgi:hypothetical protein
MSAVRVWCDIRIATANLPHLHGKVSSQATLGNASMAAKGKVNACRFPAETGGRCRGGSTNRQTIVNRGEQCRASGNTVYGKPPPLATIPHIGKNAGAIFVKMQKRLATDVKNARPLLDQSRPAPEALQHLAK